MPPKQGTTAAVRIRRAKAMDLRTRGYSFQRIADELGVSYKQAWDDVQAEFAALPRGDIDQYRREALERLDRLQDKLQDRIDELAEVQEDEDGEYWVVGEIEKTTAAVLRVEERRARLLGLDAPVRAEVEVKNVTVNLRGINSEEL